MGRAKIIAIIEIDYHPEVLRNFIEMLVSRNFEVRVFTLQQIWDHASVSILPGKIEVFIAKNRWNTKSLIHNNLKVINSCDLVIFNTLASNFKLFGAINYQPPVLLRVHNSNTYLNFSWKNLDLRPSLFFIWKDLSYFLRRVILRNEIYYRRKFINNRVDYFSFPEKTLAEYAIQNGFVQRERVIGFIPFAYSKPGQTETEERDFVSITIVGYVDKRKKDYNEIFRAFKNIVPKLTDKVVLNFLGKPVGLQGKVILQKFKKLQTSNFKVNSYRSFVANNEFNRVITNTDFLLIPVTQFYHFTIFKEVAAKTKMSGNINDVIVFGKPALIPSYFNLESKIKQLFSTYSNPTGLGTILMDWIGNKPFRSIDTNHILKSRSLKKVAEEVEKSLLYVIEKHHKVVE